MERGKRPAPPRRRAARSPDRRTCGYLSADTLELVLDRDGCDLAAVDVIDVAALIDEDRGGERAGHLVDGADPGGVAGVLGGREGECRAGAEGRGTAGR